MSTGNTDDTGSTVSEMMPPRQGVDAAATRGPGHVMIAESLKRWCEGLFGATANEVLFSGGHLSSVFGVRLADGRNVVVKARPASARIAACCDVQRRLWERGFPCPEPLAGPILDDGLMVTAERFVPGGQQLVPGPDSPVLFAQLLADLVRMAPSVEDVGVLDPPPPWVGWDHGEGGLWPTPDDSSIDLNTCEGPEWLDAAAAEVRERLGDERGTVVIGHGDWESQNIRWTDRHPHVVHDWDSVVARSEPTLVGVAAAVFTATGEPGAATVQETAAFLAAYQQARHLRWSRRETAGAWAAGVWVRAFNAKKRFAHGLLPDLTAGEAARRVDLSRP
jgi:Ser/Thr protein kinase RdoA (MazF antagonist)